MQVQSAAVFVAPNKRARSDDNNNSEEDISEAAGTASQQVYYDAILQKFVKPAIKQHDTLKRAIPKVRKTVKNLEDKATNGQLPKGLVVSPMILPEGTPAQITDEATKLREELEKSNLRFLIAAHKERLNTLETDQDKLKVNLQAAIHDALAPLSNHLRSSVETSLIDFFDTELATRNAKAQLLLSNAKADKEKAAAAKSAQDAAVEELLSNKQTKLISEIVSSQMEKSFASLNATIKRTVKNLLNEQGGQRSPRRSPNGSGGERRNTSKRNAKNANGSTPKGTNKGKNNRNSKRDNNKKKKNTKKKNQPSR